MTTICNAKMWTEIAKIFFTATGCLYIGLVFHGFHFQRVFFSGSCHQPSNKNSCEHGTVQEHAPSMRK